MQKARNDAIEAQQNKTVALSASLDKVSSSIVSNVFKPMHTTATPTTVASTTSGPNLDPDWTSPVAVTSVNKPPVQPPNRRTFLRRKLYQTTITWGDRDSFAEYMHDCYGGDKDFTLMPVVPLDKVKHPWNEELRSRKDLIIQLQELEDPTYTAEILTNKKRIIEVRPIFPLIRSFW